MTRSHQPATPAAEVSTAEPARSWLDRAACREVDPEIFFPISTTGAALSQIHQAKVICARCPVAADCLDWALHVGQDHGVWGGTTPEERRALRTIGPRARNGTLANWVKKDRKQGGDAAGAGGLSEDGSSEWPVSESRKR